MKPDTELPKNPAEDRAALREELLRSNESGRLEVFDALNREADDDDEEVPAMPEGLRDQLIEQFGERTPRQTPATTAPQSPGFFESVIAFFQARPLAAYGGLAAAACAVLFIVVQLGGPGGAGDGGGTQTDLLRGDAQTPSGDGGCAGVPIPQDPKRTEVVEQDGRGTRGGGV